MKNLAVAFTLHMQHLGTAQSSPYWLNTLLKCAITFHAKSCDHSSCKVSSCIHAHASPLLRTAHSHGHVSRMAPGMPLSGRKSGCTLQHKSKKVLRSRAPSAVSVNMLRGSSSQMCLRYFEGGPASTVVWIRFMALRSRFIRFSSRSPMVNPGLDVL